MTTLILGGSSGLGKALAEEYAKNGEDLVIIARDERDLNALKSDLSLRFGVSVNVLDLDVSDGEYNYATLVEKLSRWGELQHVLLPIGSVMNIDDIELSTDDTNRLVKINFLGPVNMVKLLLSSCKKNATITGFGSIADTRGRNANIAYSAAKRALRSFFESLRHNQAHSQRKIQFYILGYIDTQLSYGIKTPLPKANPDKVARYVYSNRNKDFSSKYIPFYWKYLTFILKILPWTIYKNLKF